MAYRFLRPTPTNLRDVLKLERGWTQAARVLKDAERSFRPQDIEKAMEYVEECMGGAKGGVFGIESIETGEYQGGYFSGSGALYLNTGDTYNTTLLYDVEEDRFYITTWGDWVEAEEARGRVIPNRAHPFRVVEAHRGMVKRTVGDEERRRRGSKRYAVAGIDRQGNDWSLGEFVGYDDAVHIADTQRVYPQAVVIDLQSGQVIYQPKLAANPAGRSGPRFLEHW